MIDKSVAISARARGSIVNVTADDKSYPAAPTDPRVGRVADGLNLENNHKQQMSIMDHELMDNWNWRLGDFLTKSIDVDMIDTGTIDRSNS